MTHAATNHRSVLDNDQSDKSDIANLADGEEQVHIIRQLRATDLTDYTYKLISNPRKGLIRSDGQKVRTPLTLY